MRGLTPIIGVLPSSFVYSSSFGGNTIELWTPVEHEAPKWLIEAFGDHEFLGLAKLRPGVTQAALISQLDTVQKRIKASHPEPAVHDGVMGRPMLDDVVEKYKTPLYALLAATGCVFSLPASTWPACWWRGPRRAARRWQFGRHWGEGGCGCCASG